MTSRPLAAMLLASFFVAPAMAAEPATVPASQGPDFRVSALGLSYARPHAQHPPLDELNQLVVELGKQDGRLVAPAKGLETVSFKLSEVPGGSAMFTAGGLTAVCEQLVKELNRRGLMGVMVAPKATDIDPNTSKDLRPAGATKLELVIQTTIVKKVEAVDASGSPGCDRIWRLSPLQPPQEGRAGNLLRADDLADYVDRLNRFGGRRVQAEVAGAEAPGEATLRYHVEEEKPWLAYAQAGNTGTDRSGRWQERGGLIYRQLAKCDDVFLVDYLTSSFDQVHAISSSYESAFPASDTLRWRLAGAWNKDTSSDLGITGPGFTTTQTTVSGELIYTFYQRQTLFLDAVGGVDFEYLTLEGFSPGGHGSLVLPHVGLRAEQERATDNFFATMMLYRNIPTFAGTDSEQLSTLGRPDTDADFTLLRWNVEESFYLDPLWMADAAPVGRKLPFHEIAGRFRGQTSIDSRLTPQIQDVIGGLYSVRGYPQAAAAGDDSLVATLEYRFHVPRALAINRVPVMSPTFRNERDARKLTRVGEDHWDWTVGPFVDLGRVMQADRAEGEFNQTLLGTGLATELRIGRNFSIRLDWGVALRDTKNNQGDAGDNRVYLLATFSY